MTFSKDPLNVKPPFRWSFSQWETYNSCPAKWNFQSRLRLPRKPPGPAAARGLQIHDTVEKYITGDTSTRLHPDIKNKYIPIFDEFKNHENGDRGCERKLAFDADWHVTATTSAYATCIAVLDAYRFTNEHILHIGEWKSGKPKDTHGDQRSLYALMGYKHWPATEVQVTTYYLEDTGPPQRLTLKSQQGFEKLRDKWQHRITTMQRDELCSPKPNWTCRFCDYAKDKGGPCIFGS